MIVRGIIENEIYKKLIDYAFVKSNTVRFMTRNDGLSPERKKKLISIENQFKKDLKKSFITKKPNEEWHKLNCYPTDIYYNYYYFQTTTEVKDYILSNQNLYAWLNPEYPEDIAFFKNGYCWLYSVAHEKLCHIYCENEEEYKYLKSIGIEFEEDDYVSIDINELYFENYMN